MVSKRKYDQIFQRVERELHNNRMWKHLVLDRYWICPYCGLVGASFDDSRQLPRLIVSHLDRQCGSWANFETPFVHISVLEQRVLEVLASQNLANDPLWKFFDDNEGWHCPFCAQPQFVKGLRTSDGMQLAKKEIVHHLKKCQRFREGGSQTVPASVLEEGVKKQNLIVRLVPQIRRRVESDDVWKSTIVDGSWICPFCLETVHSVDVSSPLTTLETAPLQMATHLRRNCDAYESASGVKGQAPHVLKPIGGSFQRSMEQRAVIEAKSDRDDQEPISIGGEPSENNPLPAPDLSLSPEEETDRPVESIDGRVQVRRWAEREQPDDRRPLQKAAQVPVEEPFTLKTDPQDPEDDGGNEEVSSEGLEEENEDHIADRERRARDGLIDRSRSRLLSRLPVNVPSDRMEIAYRFDAAPHLDGDFLHVHPVGNDRVGIAVYSLSVKGPEFVPLNEIVLEHLVAGGDRGLGPKEVACELNGEMSGVLDEGDYLSLIYGVVDGGEKTFTFINAGQPPPIEVRPYDSSPPDVIHSNGIVIGQDEGALFRALLEEKVVSLKSRNPVVLYTEGIVELVDIEGHEFGTRTFMLSIEEYARQDAAYLVDMVETRALEFVGAAPRHRDLALIALRID